MTWKKESEIRAMTKVKDSIEFCKCFAVISATGDKSELFRVLTARQIAALIDSIYDRTVVTNWVIDSGDEYLNGLNPAYTKKVVYEDSRDGETHKEVVIKNEAGPAEPPLKATPLTESELRALERKPVWVVCDSEYNNARKWEIVNFGYHEECYGITNSIFPFAHAPLKISDLGKTWNAYTCEIYEEEEG